MDKIIYIFVFIFGACVGSFLNVCIYRIPRGKSIVWPRSQCPLCKNTIQWYDNIPILSWFILKGRCRNCNGRFKFRYVLIELVTALLFLLSWHLLDVQLAIISMVFLSLLIIASFIDLDHLIIPDRITIGGFILGCFISIIIPSLHGYNGYEPYIMKSFLSLISGLTGAFLGSGLLLWIAFISEIFLKEETMGGADIKLIGCIGAFCGWKGALFSICGGACFASLILVPLILMKKLKSRNKKSAYKVVPFGPWLSLGAIVYFLLLRDPIDSYFNSINYLFNR